MPRMLPICLVALLVQGCGGRPVPAAATDAATQLADADGPAPSADAVTCSITWDCSSGPDGRYVCNSASSSGGLPPGGRDWLCHPQIVATPGLWDADRIVWTCVGEATAAGPSGGCGWDCEPFLTGLTRCTKLDGPEDRPPGGFSIYQCKFIEGGDCYACIKGSVFSGTSCERVETQRACVGPDPGCDCLPGDRLWCDGLIYDGWGMVGCDPATGRWRTRIVNGKQVLDCKERSDGRRPNSYCACYSFFTSYDCCERLDCVVPAGFEGQICPPSSGELCTPCYPQAPECIEPGARCITTNTMESFCGQDCSSDPCPAGYTCMTIETLKAKEGSVQQCVPEGLSCYHR